MAETTKTTILIIGGPHVGKTHFGGQLYGRLNSKSNFYKIISQPENLTIFREVLDKLNDGKSAEHTNVGANDVIELQVEDHDGVQATFSFPDYGGEQIKSIVTDRRLNKIWLEQIEKSDSWMLFIRPDEIHAIEDVVNRGIPNQEILEKRNSDAKPVSISDPAFFSELLQMLLYGKKVALQQKIRLPRLTIALSCWDSIELEAANKLPADILKEKLPALSSFIEANWRNEDFRVIGLSSTGKTLSKETVDKEYVKYGPEKFGYFITHDGRKEEDLTLTIRTLLGKD